MSDPGYMRFTVDGQSYLAPAQDAERIMRELDADGVKFDATPDPGPAPAAAPSAPATPAPAQPKSAMDMVMELGRRGAGSIKSGLRSAGESLYDGAVGLSQGLSMGGADELMGA